MTTAYKWMRAVAPDEFTGELLLLSWSAELSCGCAHAFWVFALQSRGSITCGQLVGCLLCFFLARCAALYPPP